MPPRAVVERWAASVQQQEREQDVDEDDFQGQANKLGLRDLAGGPASVAACKCPGGKEQCAGQHESYEERGALLRCEAAHGLKSRDLLRTHAHGSSWVDRV